MTLQLSKVSLPVLEIDTSLDDKTITARFKGTADVEAQPDLKNYLNALHSEALRVGATKVVANFHELEFMNSSSFKIFVGWLGQVRELPAAEQYKIHFVPNSNLHWQRRSLAALSCFAVDLVVIET